MPSRIRESWKTIIAVSILVLGLAYWEGCTPEQADAILAGIQVTADQLSNSNDNSDVSIRDWLTSQLNH